MMFLLFHLRRTERKGGREMRGGGQIVGMVRMMMGWEVGRGRKEGLEGIGGWFVVGVVWRRV